MIVNGADGIEHLAEYVEQQLMPLAEDDSLRGELQVAARLIRLVAEDYDRAVDVLLADRSELTPILENAITLVDDDLAEELRRRLQEEPADLRVSSLRSRADRDLLAVVRLHEALDTTGRRSPEAERLVLDIWRFLESSADRQRFDFPV